MKENIILLFGGQSRERHVSVATAQNVALAMDELHYWYWAPDGRVFSVTKDTLVNHEDPFYKDLDPKVDASWPTVETALDSDTARNCVIFNGLHGTLGEDGVLQSWLEKRHLAFTGSGTLTCQMTFDKLWAKREAKKAGILVMDSVAIQGNDMANTRAILNDFFAKHPKFIIKPQADGSTVGFHVISDDKSFTQALNVIELQPQVPYMAEVFASGVELTIGVFDSGTELVALPCTEVRADAGRVFDYEGKYLGTGIKEITPAEVAPQVAKNAQEIAVKIHKIFGCDGYSRTDLIVMEQGPIFLETNTLPGLTKSSLVPAQLKVAGISLRDFVLGQINLAKRKHEQL